MTRRNFNVDDDVAAWVEKQIRGRTFTEYINELLRREMLKDRTHTISTNISKGAKAQALPQPKEPQEDNTEKIAAAIASIATDPAQAVSNAVRAKKLGAKIKDIKPLLSKPDFKEFREKLRRLRI